MLEYRCRGGFAPITFTAIAPFFFRQSQFIILDRDGTLAPLKAIPQDAEITPSARELLCRIVDNGIGQIAIISARSLKFLKSELSAEKFVLAGNYGMEISFPSGKHFLHPSAQMAVPQIEALFEEMCSLCKQKPELILDNHEYSLCLHFHLLPLVQRKTLAGEITKLKNNFSNLKFRKLPTSYEVLPDLDWNKAMALDQIAQELDLASQDLLYLTFGDSESDEPLYLWVNARQGLSFNVGSREATRALGRVESTDDVCEFLRNLHELKTNAEGSITLDAASAKSISD